MTKKEALEGSIKKWKRIVRDTKAEDWLDANCSLCQKYSGCKICPVKLKTGLGDCDGSPWKEWAAHTNRAHGQTFRRHRVPHCKECLRLAKEELAFLESLR